MNIAVIGTGYVGLVAGTCLADSGHVVSCVDTDRKKIAQLKRGEVPIHEPGLEELIARNVNEGRLSFVSDYGEAVPQAEIVFLAVGTPGDQNGDANLSFLQGAVDEVASHLKNYTIIVNKSTAPVGTLFKIREWIDAKTQIAFDVASNPEFLKEGSAISDFLKPDRIIIGTEKSTTYKVMEELYSAFVRQGNPILWMDPISAELCKYACNAMLATRISFMNEIATLCERVGGNIEQIRHGMITDPRIGREFLYAGLGYGGSCFPKDVEAVLAIARHHKIALPIISAAQEVNRRQRQLFLAKILRFFSGSISDKRIAVWGLAFKPNTDDLREAPALTLIEALVQEGANLAVFDPVAMDRARPLLGDKVTFSDSAFAALTDADALLIATEWNEFRNPNFKKMKKVMRNPVIFDGRNLYHPEKMREFGFSYYGIGLGSDHTMDRANEADCHFGIRS